MPDEGGLRETLTERAPAPPEPTPVRPVRRRALIGWGLILVLLGTGSWLVIRGARTYDFRKECEAILRELRPGAAEAVYEGAAPRFKQTLIVDELLDLVDRIEQTLGGFQRIIAIEEVTRTSTVAGRAARIRLELEYARGTTQGEISLLSDDKGGYRLLGFSIDIPEALAARARAAETQIDRVQAPAEVLESVERILTRLREGRVAEIHGEAAPAFKTTVSEQVLRDLTRGHQQELGGFTGLLKVISSAQNVDRTRARVQALLQYEKRRTTATFDFQRLGDRWQLLGFKIVVPEPFSPISGAPPD